MANITVRVLPTWQIVETCTDPLGAVAVIDVLRATSTMAVGLAAGAREIVPVRDVDEARRESASRENSLLAGERDGHAPEGFDLGNSPLEFTNPRVGGRPVVLTTTNGTSALKAVWEKRPACVIAAALVNRQAAAEALVAASPAAGRLTLVCGGHHGIPCAEDLICAGALIDRLGLNCMPEGDAALIALAAWRGLSEPAASWLARTHHGEELAAQGFAADLVACGALDSLGVVPVYDGKAVTIAGRKEAALALKPPAATGERSVSQARIK